MTTDFIIVAILLLLFGLSMQQFVMRHVLTYRFTEDSVQAVLFGSVPVSITSYDRIEEVSKSAGPRRFSTLTRGEQPTG